MLRHKHIEIMKFVERIRQLREESQLPQRKLAITMDIDTATYCKIEKMNDEPKPNKLW
jgi:DNA-binding XRE family transcriptional regulator